MAGGIIQQQPVDGLTGEAASPQDPVEKSKGLMAERPESGQRALGMIPDGWRKTSLAQIALEPISYGVVQTGAPIEGGVPCVRVVDLASGQLSPEGMITTTPEISESYRRTVLKAGDVMIALRGIIGRAVQVPSALEGCNLTRGIARVAPDPRTVRSDFLAQFLNGPVFQGLINRQANGSALQEISIATLRAAPILIPSESEQRRIAEILATWDRAIDAADDLVANASDQKAALTQALLTGRTRLPGFNGEWTHKPISVIATRVTRRNDGTDLPVLTISSTSGFVRQDEKYRREMAGKSVESYIVLNRGEFAYNKGNSKTYQFGCIYELASYERALVPHVYVCFRLKQGYNPRFFGTLFEADYLGPQLGRLVNTGVRNNGLLNITAKEVLGTIVPVPPEEEQDAIASVLEAASAVVALETAQRDALRKEKAALMQQLLTGKRRVKLAGSEAA